MSNKTINLTETLYDYLLSVSMRETDLLKRLRQETAIHPFAEMQIAPEQGQFMALLIQLMGARKIIEIGVFTGYSSTCMALALPVGGILIACDNDEEATAIARKYWLEAGVSDKIDLRLGAAVETLEHLISESGEATFDFIFIDADKENYQPYFELALRLLRKGGLIVVDNVLWSGRPADPNEQSETTVAIREFNQKLSQDRRIALSLLPIADGLTLALKL